MIWTRHAGGSVCGWFSGADIRGQKSDSPSQRSAEHRCPYPWVDGRSNGEKSAGDEFLRYLHRPDESHLQNAAQVLLIWQIVIVDGSEQNLLQWHRILQKARLAAPITDAQVRLALGFLRETEPEMQDINAFSDAL